MADESPDRAACLSDAHECNGVREDPACNMLSESGVSMRDGTTESRISLKTNLELTITIDLA